MNASTQPAPAETEHLLRRVRELEAVRNLLQLASQAHDTPAIIRAIVVSAKAVMSASASSVILRDAPRHRLVFYEATGQAGEKLKSLFLDENQGIAGWVVTHGTEVLCNDPASDPRFAQAFSKKVGVPVKNLVCVPMVWQGETLGALEVLNTTNPQGFQPHDLLVLQALAAQAAGALAWQQERDQTAQRDRLALVGRMAGVVLHDLRNPLTVIAGFVNLLLKKEWPREQQVEYLTACLENANRMNHLADELLQYMRGRVTLAPAPINLQTLLQNVRQQTLPVLSGLNATLQTPPPPDAPLTADPEKLLRALVNLVKNAAEAAPGGEVTLTVNTQEDGVVFRVMDNGPGLDENTLEEVMQPFVSHKPGNAGLGLFIARLVAREHGGDLSLKNREGGGLMAELRIPAIG